MICNKCGKEIDNDAKVCPLCGENIEEAEAEVEVIEENINQVEEVDVDNQVQEAIIEEPTVEQVEVLPEEDKSNFSAAIYTNEFEYTKKIFNRYYRAEFVQRSLVGYIVLQVLLLNCFFVPGFLFAIIYWCITNPITKTSQWRNFLFDNKGNQPLYRFFFNENSLVVRRNRVEELTMQYKDFKKIVYTKDGILFLSKVQDFFIPIESLKNKEEIREILSKAKNVKFKSKVKN